MNQIKNSSSTHSNKPNSNIFVSYVKLVKSIIGKFTLLCHFSSMSLQLGAFLLYIISDHVGINPNKFRETALPASW